MSTNKDQIVSKSKLVTVKRHSLWSLAPGMTLGHSRINWPQTYFEQMSNSGEINATIRELGQVTKHSPMSVRSVIASSASFPHNSHYLRNTFVNCPETLALQGRGILRHTWHNSRDTAWHGTKFKLFSDLCHSGKMLGGQSSTLTLRDRQIRSNWAIVSLWHNTQKSSKIWEISQHNGFN